MTKNLNIKKWVLTYTTTAIVLCSTTLTGCKKLPDVNNEINHAQVTIHLDKNYTDDELREIFNSYNGGEYKDSTKLYPTNYIGGNITPTLKLTDEDAKLRDKMHELIKSYNYVEEITIDKDIQAYTLSLNLDVRWENINIKDSRENCVYKDDVLRTREKYTLTPQIREMLEKVNFNKNDNVTIEEIKNGTIYIKAAKEMEAILKEFYSQPGANIIKGNRFIVVEKDTDFDTLLRDMEIPEEIINECRSLIIISNPEYNFSSIIKENSALIIPPAVYDMIDEYNKKNEDIKEKKLIN